MKLNPDCIRDILLEVESETTSSEGCHLDNDTDNPLLKKYTWSEIIYHLNQCEQSHLISGLFAFETDGYAEIRDLTPAGHEFLANIRNDKIWKKILSKAMSIGSTALPIIQKIAETVIESKIK